MNKIRKNKRTLTIGILIVFLIVFTGGLLWFNSGIQKTPLRPMGGTEFAKATVLEVLSSDTAQSEEGELQGNQLVRVKITSGPYAGEECEAQSPNANHTGAYCSPGLKVVLLVNQDAEGSLVASVYNYDRGGMLWLLIGLFLLVLCLVGGKRGVTSAVGLVFTFVCIIFLYVPMMYVGVSPFLAATVVAVLVTIVTMLLIGGWSAKTLCSILGTVSGVLLAGLLALLFGRLSHISGLNTPDIETLSYIGQNSGLDVSGVLFSGILIASLGAVMDVSMSVASALNEIKLHNPGLTAGRLFRSGMNIGRDMMGTMSNTLILAFAGGAINTLIILYAYNMPYLQFMNQYEIGIEILRSMTGTLGVILTVPFVSLISSILLTRSTPAANRCETEGEPA